MFVEIETPARTASGQSRGRYGPRLSTKLPGPAAQEIVAEDARLISPSYTRGYPLVVKRGRGCRIEDVDGNEFLDLTAGIGVNSIKVMRDAALTDPGNRTDILGALDVAKQEFEAGEEDGNQRVSRKSLIVLSDFLEDDGTYNFASDRAMTSSDSARKLAERLQKEHSFALSNVRVHLGSLGSTDSNALTSQRQRTVREFWKTYFAPTNAEAEIQIDVSGAP